MARHFNTHTIPSDRLWQKLLVGTLVILDVLSSVLAMMWFYTLFINGWGNIAAFASADWLLAADPMIAGVVAGLVELFFAWRLHVLGNRYWLTIFIIACALFTFLGGVGTGIAVYWVGNFALLGAIRPIVMLWQISAVVADITITVTLTYHLRYRRTSIRATDRLLDRITQREYLMSDFLSPRSCALVTIQNGLVTTLVTLADFALYLATVSAI